MKPLVAAVAVLVALTVGVQAQTPEMDALRGRLAADQGDAGAQYNLGNMYANGEGVPQDDAEAVRWYRLGARGESPAAFDRRCNPPGGVAPRSQMPQFAPSSRLTIRAHHRSLCNAGFHHGLLAPRTRSILWAGHALLTAQLSDGELLQFA